MRDEIIATAMYMVLAALFVFAIAKSNESRKQRECIKAVSAEYTTKDTTCVADTLTMSENQLSLQENE